MPQANSQPNTPARQRALSPAKRKRIESRIEELIAVLDAQDAPTEDMEEGGDDEPDNDREGSLGWTEDYNQDRAIKACLNDAGVICGPDREADESDSEPSLGSCGGTYDAEYFDQRGWAGGSTNDAEGDEHDGREPDEDGEYEMGWPDLIDQERAARSMRGTVNLGGDQWWPAYCEGEPSLGSSEQIDQRGWSRGGTRDLEHEHDGREPECEDEGAQVD